MTENICCYICFDYILRHPFKFFNTKHRISLCRVYTHSTTVDMDKSVALKSAKLCSSLIVLCSTVVGGGTSHDSPQDINTEE